MRLLVTGAQGQVGWELQRSLMPLGEVIALDRQGCDLACLESLPDVLDRARPDVIVNAAAYTAVDRAEHDEALATRINGDAVAVLADWAARHGALLIHYSTDYVFDGSKDAPYIESDMPAPLNAYGRSKLAGERALQSSSADYLCLRVSWVYAGRGRNFVQTMLRLARERDHLRVVADQVGAPTWARNIADVTAALIVRARERRVQGCFQSGLFHLSPEGETSWHGFAEKIFELTREQGHALRVDRVEPIASAEYPTPAARPHNSRMSADAIRQVWGIYLPDWSQALALMLADLQSVQHSGAGK